MQDGKINSHAEIIPHAPHLTVCNLCSKLLHAGTHLEMLWLKGDNSKNDDNER